MTAYISVAAGAVFLTVVVGMIIPDGKLNKSVNFVLRMACILILISPVFGIFNITLPGEDGGIVDYDYVSEVFSQSQSAELEKLIEENVGIDCDCSVSIIYEDGSFKETGVTVYAENVGNDLIDEVVSYLRELGYININVHEKTS